MKVPRDLSYDEVVRALASFGYRVVRQTGSHVRLTTTVGGEHHVTVPAHKPIRIGTLRAIVRAVAAHHGKSIDDAMRELFE